MSIRFQDSRKTLRIHRAVEGEVGALEWSSHGRLNRLHRSDRLVHEALMALWHVHLVLFPAHDEQLKLTNEWIRYDGSDPRGWRYSISPAHSTVLWAKGEARAQARNGETRWLIICHDEMKSVKRKRNQEQKETICYKYKRQETVFKSWRYDKVNENRNKLVFADFLLNTIKKKSLLVYKTLPHLSFLAVSSMWSFRSFEKIWKPEKTGSCFGSVWAGLDIARITSFNCLNPQIIYEIFHYIGRLWFQLISRKISSYFLARDRTFWEKWMIRFSVQWTRSEISK